MHEVIKGTFPNHGRQRLNLSLVMHTSGFEMEQLLFGYDEARARRDLAFINQDRATVERICFRVEQMRNLLFIEMPMLEFELEQLAERRARIHALEFSDLCRQIVQSTSGAWPRLRMQYATLVIEFIARLHQVETFVSNQR